MIDITKRLRDLADQLEALDNESAEPARPWPPKGVTIHIPTNGAWQPRTSAGDGYYYYPNGGLQSLNEISLTWQYAPAPWDLVPSNYGAPARGWVVTSSGECLWVWRTDLVVGDVFRTVSTIVHVEYRDDV